MRQPVPALVPPFLQRLYLLFDVLKALEILPFLADLLAGGRHGGLLLGHLDGARRAADHAGQQQHRGRGYAHGASPVERHHGSLGVQEVEWKLVAATVTDGQAQRGNEGRRVGFLAEALHRGGVEQLARGLELSRELLGRDGLDTGAPGDEDGVDLECPLDGQVALHASADLHRHRADAVVQLALRGAGWGNLHRGRAAEHKRVAHQQVDLGLLGAEVKQQHRVLEPASLAGADAAGVGVRSKAQPQQLGARGGRYLPVMVDNGQPNRADQHVGAQRLRAVERRRVRVVVALDGEVDHGLFRAEGQILLHLELHHARHLVLAGAWRQRDRLEHRLGAGDVHQQPDAAKAHVLESLAQQRAQLPRVARVRRRRDRHGRGPQHARRSAQTLGVDHA